MSYFSSSSIIEVEPQKIKPMFTTSQRAKIVNPSSQLKKALIAHLELSLEKFETSTDGQVNVEINCDSGELDELLQKHGIKLEIKKGESNRRYSYLHDEFPIENLPRQKVV